VQLNIEQYYHPHLFLTRTMSAQVEQLDAAEATNGCGVKKNASVLRVTKEGQPAEETEAQSFGAKEACMSR
jgi:hypothetical protein